MVHGSNSIPKKVLRKTPERPHPRDCFDNLMRAEFFNGAFRRSLLIVHECQARRNGPSVITG